MSRISLPSTQSHINIARIQDGVVITKDGGLRMVLLVTAVNFALKREEEQNALVYQYQNFLNSLTFAIQIVVQSRQLDLTGYLAKLDQRLAAQTNELLQIQTADYIDFVKKMISMANIMDKKFFIVIPYNPTNLASRSFFDRLLHPNKTAPDIGLAEFKRFREELLQRINVVMSGLAPMGLRSVPLDTQQLIELYYQTFNPE
ncbi:MAG: hypothetical protein AAB390_02770, partial [Patescibacteria group bacterium]